jgi:hypothetical protein
MLLFLAWGVGSPAHALDEAAYAAVLARHTSSVADIASTRVDYAALRSSAEWKAVVASLAASDPARLGSRAESLAFWINVYNILAIDLVVRHYPVDSIRDIGSLFAPVWQKPAGVVGKRAYSLDEIEHQILRRMGDPRIHAAIVCASLSCPPLRREPYRAREVGAQLDDNVRRWLADPRKGMRIDPHARRVWLSPIFRWFASDFAEGAFAFLARHAAPEQRAALESIPPEARSIAYLDYDWSLNDVRTRGR